jgi:ELWxxDGT repeat protein
MTFAALVAATGVHAQTATLVKDIYPGNASTTSSAVTFERILGVSNGRAFLTGWEVAEQGLFLTDGTSGGTRLVIDVAPLGGADVDGSFLFGAVTQERGSLWKTDGTIAGTQFVRRFSPDLSVAAHPSRFLKVGSRLSFVVDDGVHGSELWTSDGTAAGTRLVKELTPGPAGSFDSYASFADVGGTLYFSCGSTPGCGLWKSDGTEAGTAILANLESVSSLVNLSGTLFFTASDPAHGTELWKSDGTPAGTILVEDLLPGATDSTPFGLVTFGGALYFSLPGDGSLWRSDGTAAGTVPLGPVPCSTPLVPSGGRLFFTSSGSQLWATDGTDAGTALIRDLGTSFDLSSAVVVPGALLFWVPDGASGLALWRSDGMPAGTSLVKTITSATAAPSPGSGVSIPGSAILLVNNAPASLYRSDGTSAGTGPVVDPAFEPNDGLPLFLTDLNGTLLFAATDADHGTELWRSDGTAEGTILVKDLVPGPESSYPKVYYATSSNAFFQAATPEMGCELYRTDGTEAGTGLLKNFLPGPECGISRLLGVLGNLFLFVADDGEHGREPWRSDGTPEGTFLLADLVPGAASGDIWPMSVLNGALFFSFYDGPVISLWKTDGTSAGTVAIGPMPPYLGASGTAGGLLVFSGDDPIHGTELWRTDGTAAGTTFLLDINPLGDSFPGSFLQVGSRLVFFADDGTHGQEPWVTDGTAAGTALLKDINPGPPRSVGFRYAVLGSTLFFFAYDGVHGYELWKTDGTGPGTLLVRDVAPGPPGSMMVERIAAGGHEVFFTASDHVAGRELWRSNGTEAGTTRITDLVPGIRSSPVPWSLNVNRPDLVRSGGRVYFAARDATSGYELWSVPVPTMLHTIVPCRVADSRDPDGPTGGVPLGASETIILPVTGRCCIPSTALSVAANVTVVNPTATGSLSVFADGPIVSGTTEVPVTAGRTRALNAVPILGTAGSLSVRAALPEGGSTHVLLDVSGYFE